MGPSPHRAVTQEEAALKIQGTVPIEKLRVLDLFSGIGGFSLGLERAGGFRTVAFCEIDPYCRAVLRKHWPDIPIYGDIREFDGVECDVICGGFPCQDISSSGNKIGITGCRSALWVQFHRILCNLRPTYAIVENVSDLLSRGLGDVLGDLAEIGFDAEWRCIPASAVGAPHRRDRVWIVANPAQLLSDGGNDHPCRDQEGARPLLDLSELGNTSGDEGTPRRWNGGEPAMGRVAYGVPDRVDRLKGLGNAVVPKIPELIGRAILMERAA